MTSTGEPTSPRETEPAVVDTISVDQPHPSPPPPPTLAPIPTPAPDTIGMRLFCVVAIALIACLATWHGWRKGYVLAPTDALQLVSPWAHGEDYVARNEQLFDQTVQFVPWTFYTVERYRQGQIPLWNPHSQLGAPFLANGQSAIFYPTILLHLKLPETWSWTISAALRLAIAGWGAYVLAGRYGLRRVPRLLSALAFMLCGFNVVWLNHPQMNVIPLLPWAIVLTEMLIERVRLHRILGAALLFAVQFLGGHPASCVHLLLACAVVWVLRITLAPTEPTDRPRRALASGLALVASIVLGFALAAAQWLPLIEYAHNSGAAVVRHDRLAHEPFFALDPRYLLGLAFPYANGFPDGVAPFEMRRVTHLPNTNELAAGYVGTIPIVLAIFAMITLRRRRIVLMWLIIAAVAAAIAIKLPGVDHLVRHIPALNVAQNARLLVVTALALALLAGFGLQELLDRVRAGADMSKMRRILGRTAIALAALAILAALVLLVAKGPILSRGYAKAEAEYNQSKEHEHSLDHVKTIVRRVHLELIFTSLRLLIPAAALGAGWFVLRGVQRDQTQSRTRPRHGGLWTTLAVAELLAFAIPFNPGSPAQTYFPETAAIQKLRDLPPGRLAGTYRTLPPETSTPYLLSDLRGYDALAPKRYYQWWSHPGIGDLDPAMQGYLSKLENPEHAAWSLLNFTYLLTPPGHPVPPADRFTPIGSAGGDANLYRLTNPRPRAWVAPRAQTYETLAAVLDRVAKMDFDPDQLVLLDREGVPPIPEQSGSNIAYASPRRASVEVLPPAKPEDDRPEVINFRVTGASGGYLVLADTYFPGFTFADTYFPGWTATVSDPRGGVKEEPILPAYGVLRAVPLPAAAASVRVEMRYNPWSWRLGAMTSITSACLFILLAGATMFPRTTPK